MSKENEVSQGWVIYDKKDDNIYSFTFERTRTDCIFMWISLWNSDVVSWQKFKRQGYKCVKAKQAIEII